MKLKFFAAAAMAAAGVWAGVRPFAGGGAEIVVAERATQAARFGALDLQWHLREMTGRTLPVVKDSEAGAGFKFLVGPSRFTRTDAGALTDQQYAVEVREGAVEMVGADEQKFGGVEFEATGTGIRFAGKPGMFEAQGSMYAVYQFLEDWCGVDWVDAWDWGTIVPKEGNPEFRKGRKVYEPFMAYRGGTVEYRPSPLLWKAGTEEWKEFHDAAFREKDERRRRDAYSLFQARRRVGGMQGQANHSFYWWYERFLDEKSANFEAKRPELFAKGYAGVPPQLCYSSGEVIETTVKDIRDYLARGGYAKNYRTVGRGLKWGKGRYCLEPMDNTSFCKCERCAAQYEPERRGDKSEHSTYWFRFVKAVAERIRESNPEAKISTLAYYSHEGLPRGVRLPDNVEVYFCISGNRENPRGDLARRQMERMKEWHGEYPGMRLGLWLYGGFPVEFAHNGNFECLPGYFAREAGKQYRFFKDVGARTGVFNCGLDGEVCQYLAYQLMLDPEKDMEAMLGKYFSQYGAAAGALRKFYDLVEERHCGLEYRKQGVGMRETASFWRDRCPPEVVKELEGYVREAERLADTEAAKARVELFKLSQWRWIKKGAETYAKRSAAPMPEWTAERVAEAGGDLERVNWEGMRVEKLKTYEQGSEVERPEVMETEMRLGHDGKWLYMELVQKRDMALLEISGKIFPCDDWELVMSAQRAQPYRCYFMDADSRVMGSSWGEVNWRQGVSSEESHGDRAYFARVKSVVDRAGNRWVQRVAMPLDKFLDKPMKAGDTFYMTPVAVTSARAGKTAARFGIFSPVSWATVHTVDRSGAVKLAEGAAPVAEYRGTPGAAQGWKLVASEAGKVTYIPFEGYYESKGGRIESPEFALDKREGENAYYMLTFEARGAEDGYWWVDWFDREGKMLPDVNSQVEKSAEWRAYRVVAPAGPEAVRAKLAFVSKSGVEVRNVSMRRIGVKEAAAWCEELYAGLPQLSGEAPAGAWDRLPRTKAALAGKAKKLKVVLLGDSIINDSYCGLLGALVQNEFPETEITFQLSVRGSTGCWHYRDEKNFEEYVGRHKPDLVIIGGISNYNPPKSTPTLKDAEEAMVEVIGRCRAIGAEVAVASPSPSYEFRESAEAKEFDLALTRDVEGGAHKYLFWGYERAAAERAGAQFWDLTTGPCGAIARSGKPLWWFKRDGAHSNDRGKQLIAQAYKAIFKSLR